MDFLDHSVIPQSANHLILLKYLLGLTYILFLPYISVLFGILVFSLYFKRKSDKTNNDIYQEFSKQLIDIITFNKGIAFVLGILPLVVFIFGYSQIFHLTESNIPFMFMISLCILVIALLFSYTYKYTLHFKEIFEYANEKKAKELSESKIPEEFADYNIQTDRLSDKSGKYGLILLMASTYIFTGAIHLASNSSSWENGGTLFGIVFSITTFLNYLQFIAASLAITSAIIIYKLLKDNSLENGLGEITVIYLRNFFLKTGLISTIVLPGLIILTTMNAPVLSLSYNYFISILLALLLLIGITILFYLMIKEESYPKNNPLLIGLFLLLFTILVIHDQVAIDTSFRNHSVILAADYDAYVEKLNESLGIETKPISGADIYNGRCIACHRFDVKVVGPPYNQTLPKYEGKKQELVNFIMNPVKKNPDYPPMPNQGLKPKEAEAVAEFLLNTYKKSNN